MKINLVSLVIAVIALTSTATLVTAASTPTIPRSVAVTTLYQAQFSDAIDAKGQINFNGNNVRVDSFNSTNAAYSDMTANGYGTYDVNKAEAHGNVATDSSIVGAVSAGQANVYGTVNTGPGGTASIGNNGYVGPLPQPNGTSGIQPGYSNDTMNVTFPDVTVPAGASSWQALPSGGVITSSGNYYSSGIGGTLVIAAPYVTIYVNGNIGINGNDAVVISNNVVNVSLYVAGPSVSIKGNGVLNNTGHASAFSIYGLPTLTSVDLGGNGAVLGTLYAPEANFQFGGSGNSAAQDWTGAIVVNTVTLSGHANFHYDESLATIGPGRGYVPTSWKEIGVN